MMVEILVEAIAASVIVDQLSKFTREASPERGVGTAASCLPPLGKHLVAKFYCLLYYHHKQGIADPFLACKATYTIGATAYMALARL